MSEPTKPESAAAPAAAEPPKPAAAPAPEAPPKQEQPYLADRLERERRSVLKQLGIKPEKGVPVQSQIDAAKQKLESRKEKLREVTRIAEESTAKATAAEEKLKVLASFAAIEMNALDEKTRETVKQLAGDDPAEQLKQIAAIRALMPAKAPVAPAPASTATPPPPAAPASAAATAEVPVKERWAQINSIQNENQREIAKVLFALQHGLELLNR